MKSNHLIFGLLAAALTGSSFSQEGAETQLAQARANEQRVRDTLRTTTQQLRAVEAEKATLLAGQTERDQKLSSLEARLTAATSQADRDREEAVRTITKLTAEADRKDQELARLRATLDKWKASHAQAAALLKKGESVRARLENTNLALERTVADRERQNLELYKTGSEILQRYADFSLGRALAAREPFTGLARARLEEQIEGYADQLQDARIKPVPSDGRPSTVPAPAAQSAHSSARNPNASTTQTKP
jgi:ribosomal 50S subunit-associated protein YjgA (DUF615 family)